MKYAKPKNKIEERVLAWCNRVREGLGLKPRKAFVKGICENDCFDCLLARTIGNECSILDNGTYHFGEYLKENLLPMPKYVHEFERRFEDRAYPHLIA